jgi:outer membrane beta-barrel protein
MKRAAFGLCAWLVLASQAAMAQTPGGDEPAAPPADEPPAAEPPSAEAPKEGDVQTPVEQAKAGTADKYGDVFIVPRRPVLKRRRVELMPTYNVTINDPVIRHHGFGAELNIYLSEAFFIGVEGTYYAKQLTDRYFLLGVDQRVLPSVNHYVWSALLDFGYVPIHGKFTFFNSSIVHWEVYIQAGVGVFQSEVIPRDPANTGFSNYLIAGLLPGIGTRMWLSRWFAIDAYIKNYIFADQLEPTNRIPGETSDMAASRAESQFTFDLTFGLGISIFLPPGFEYKTLR